MTQTLKKSLFHDKDKVRVDLPVLVTKIMYLIKTPLVGPSKTLDRKLATLEMN